MYGWVIFLHVLAATVWTGGHLVLATTVLPRALRQRSPQRLLDFEQGYERIGMPALAIQVVTGLWIAGHAGRRVRPRRSRAALPRVAGHVAAVTLLSVAFVAVGISFRFGGV